MIFLNLGSNQRLSYKNLLFKAFLLDDQQKQCEAFTKGVARGAIPHLKCNCNYFFFTKLLWLGDSEGTIRSSSQAATCPPVYHTRRRLHTVPLIAERQAGKL